MLVSVTQIDSLSQVYIQYSGDSTDNCVQQQLQTLIALTAEISAESSTYPQLENIQPGTVIVSHGNKDLV